MPCSSVFNLVLASGHVIDVGGAACVTLAHGIVDDEVAGHEYFGTAAVLEDLRGMGRGFDDGLLVFRHGCIARAPDGRVVGYQKSHLVPGAAGEGSPSCTSSPQSSLPPSTPPSPRGDA